MSQNDFKKLDVWKRSVELAVNVYIVCNEMPKYETFGLSDQLRRSSVSIASNIAEGQKRSGKQETIRFTSIALGSLAELETQLIITSRVHSIDVNELLSECEIISRMLKALIVSLRKM